MRRICFCIMLPVVLLLLATVIGHGTAMRLLANGLNTDLPLVEVARLSNAATRIGQTKIEHFHGIVIRDFHVGGFEIAMDDPAFVRVLQSVRRSASRCAQPRQREFLPPMKLR